MNKEPVILAIETSSRIGSIALGFGKKIVVETSFSDVMKHSSEIFPSIARLLTDFGMTPDKIEHLYISYGPGSFTGLRIAVTLAKMLYLTNSIKIITVDSLDVIAYNVIKAIEEHDSMGDVSERIPKKGINKIAAVLDAKRGQFFIAEYKIIRNGSDLSLDKLTDDSLTSAGEFCKKVTAEGNPIWLLGDGLLYYQKEFQDESINILEDKYWSPRASCVYQLGLEMAQKGQFANLLKLKPNYLHRPEIHIKSR